MKKKRSLNLEKYVLRLLALRPRSEFEIRSRLERKKFSKKDIGQILKKLKSGNLVNDRYFAGAWVRNRAILKPEGKRLLSLELRQKGIAREIIDEVLNFNEDTELELARQALAAKKRIYADLDPIRKKQKSLAFLARRGFSYPISLKALENIEK